MITNDPEQISNLQEGGAILARVLNLLAKRVKPGVSAFELDQLAEKEIKRLGATSSFKNYRAEPGDPPFPSTLCVSVNDEVVHGIPSKDKILQEGDIVGLDLGVWYKKLCTDAAITVPVGKISAEKKRLLQMTQRCLDNALSVVKAGVTTGDIGFATENTLKKEKMQVVRELVGHGVGKAVHEDPEIPCFGKPGTGTKLVAGMVVAIEPMVNLGHWKVRIAEDNWTIETYDGRPSAHFEHTVLVTNDGYEILTQE